MQNNKKHHDTGGSHGPLVQLTLPVVLPGIGEDDQCVQLLTERMQALRLYQE